jgi:hypothetical protein
MSAKHTPGPWVVDATKTLGAYGVWTDYATHAGHDGAGYGSQICSLLPNQDEITREQRDANACLIAAAPELLAACKELLPHAERSIERLSEQMVGSLYPAINAAMLQRARDAIAKAERSGAA